MENSGRGEYALGGKGKLALYSRGPETKLNKVGGVAGETGSQ